TFKAPAELVGAALRQVLLLPDHAQRLVLAQGARGVLLDELLGAHEAQLDARLQRRTVLDVLVQRHLDGFHDDWAREGAGAAQLAARYSGGMVQVFSSTGGFSEVGALRTQGFLPVKSQSWTKRNMFVWCFLILPLAVSCTGAAVGVPIALRRTSDTGWALVPSQLATTTPACVKPRSSICSSVTPGQKSCTRISFSSLPPPSKMKPFSSSPSMSSSRTIGWLGLRPSGACQRTGLAGSSASICTRASFSAVVLSVCSVSRS